jgi:hypothetical protein
MLGRPAADKSGANGSTCTEVEPQPAHALEPGPEPKPVRPTDLNEPPPEALIVSNVGRRAPALVTKRSLDGGLASGPRLGRRGAAIIATGVFAGGSAEMVVGYRYLISLTEKTLQISGPVDVAPQRVVFKAPRATVEAAALDSDLVIGAETSSGDRVQLAFRSVAGGKGDDLVAVLDQVPHVQTAPKAIRRRPRSRVG